MHKCGRLVLADIGIDADASWHEIAAPVLPPLDPGGHKYDRGLVHALAGAMPGAIALAAKAAAFAGAGYVRVSTSRPIDGLPSAIVQIDHAPVNDERIGCLFVGPGLGDVPQVLTLALTSKAPKVIDADGITHLGDPERLKGQDAIITPHEGEFRKLFGEIAGSKPERALEGGATVGRGRGLQRTGHAGCRARRPAWLCASCSSLAGERWYRRCARRGHRRDACPRAAGV